MQQSGAKVAALLDSFNLIQYNKPIMDSFEKHKTAWKVIIVVAGLALVLASFLPYLALLTNQQ